MPYFVGLEGTYWPQTSAEGDHCFIHGHIFTGIPQVQTSFPDVVEEGLHMCQLVVIWLSFGWVVGDVVDMQVLGQLVEAIPLHHFGNEEILKHGISRPVHVECWQLKDTHVHSDAQESCHLFNSCIFPLGIWMASYPTGSVAVGVGLISQSLE
jgi:hypothetical protein